MKLPAMIFAVSLWALAATVAAAEKTARQHVDDSWIHTKAKSELIGYGSSNINIEVYQGVVQLAGFVDTQ